MDLEGILWKKWYINYIKNSVLLSQATRTDLIKAIATTTFTQCLP